MFRTFARKFLPNPLDRICRKALKNHHSRILIGWNRGLGDIALGLYAIVHRIREYIPEAKITFLVRKNLLEGFSLLKHVEVLAAPDWKRSERYSIEQTLQQLSISADQFDLIIASPSPTDWVSWQRGTLTPKLSWDPSHDEAHLSFSLSKQLTYFGAHVSAETAYGTWRNWPASRWEELAAQLLPHERLILFGIKASPIFHGDRIVDLRGKTNLYEALSLIKNCCHGFIAPDSGLLSMVYYLDAAFPLKLISLWSDPKHGILKQNVSSPNPLLQHTALFSDYRDLSTLSVERVLCALR